MSASVDVLPHRPPSLLDRRASTSLQRRLSLLSQAAPSPAGPAFVRAAHRKPDAPFLPFVPLTPIMASPLLTPEVAHAPTPAAVLDSAAREHSSGHDPPPQEQDYISHHVPARNPTWTTSPPTPPPKLSSSPRVASSLSSSPVRAARGRSRSNSRPIGSRSTSRSGPRPASLASYAPTPLSRSYSPSPSIPAPSASPAATKSLSTRRMSLPADLSKPLPPRPVSADGAPKELPPVPTKCTSALIDNAADEVDEPTALLPSLSRRAVLAHPQPGAASIADSGETSTPRGRTRKLFSLADDEAEGDLSDSEEQRNTLRDRDQKRVPAREAERAQGMVDDRAPDLEQERQRLERVRRYHALMELLTTEVGYLLDLRALVTVYLDQLLLISSPPPAPALPPLGPSGLPTPPVAQPLCLGVPLPSSGRSMSSLSALVFPSSRSSFFHHSPGPSPSPSTSDFAFATSHDKESDDHASRERTRQSSVASTSTESAHREREREREREKENIERIPPPKQSRFVRHSGPVLAEKEVRAVCRNAQELLQFHERFVGELRAAVGLVGFAMMSSGDEEWINDMRGDGANVISDLVEHAVEVVATKFINEATSFGIYEQFCPGHAAATDLVRRTQERWPGMWDAYEQRCASLISRNPDTSAHIHARGRSDNTPEAASSTSPASEEGATVPPEGPMRKKRRHSTPTLSLPPIVHEGAGVPAQLPFPSASSPGASTSPSANASPNRARTRGPAPPKLKLMDYLIKPVQRICKYPLLLDQLRPKLRNGSTVQQAAADEAVRQAGEVMRGVVSRVNRASEKEAHNLRSALIASRIAFVHSPPQSSNLSSPSAPSAYPTPPTPASSSASSSSHGHASTASPSSASSCVSSPATTVSASATASHGGASLPPLTVPVPSQRAAGLTAEFVSSLGPCMLAGALDVIHHPAAHRAKYLGAFLYAGGYFILVKITKGGRVYEPRHWFALGAVEVVDADEDDPAFPYSFHVSTAQGHHLQLGAACAQEKAIWLSAINDALAAKPAWANEPFPSFQADDKSPASAPDDAPQHESPPGLPPIQSLPELDMGQSQPQTVVEFSTAPQASKAQLKYSRTLSRLDSLAHRPDQPQPPQPTFSAALSRRSSTASVKAFFAPISFDSSARVARPSAQVRAQVEHALHDIFSETCLAARAQAQMRGEEPFQVRAGAPGRRQGSGIPRSNSGISIASAMGLTAAKRRYDNVLVSRRKASVEGVPDLPVPGENAIVGTEMNTSVSASVSASASAGAGAAAAAGSSSGMATRAKSLAVRRHKKQPASIAPAITTAIAQLHAEAAETQRRGTTVRSPEALSLDSPPAASHCSSVSSHPGSMLPSPAETSPLPIPVPGLSPSGTLRQSDILQAAPEDVKPKRARSMVGNVRSFFNQPRPGSPSVSRSSSSDAGHGGPATPPLFAESPTSEYQSGIVQWLRRTSIRRRDSGSSGSRSTDDHYHGGRHPLPTRNSTDGVSTRTPVAHAQPRSHFLTSQSPRRVAFNSSTSEASAPKRRRSLFVPSSRSRDHALAAARDDGPAADAGGAPEPGASLSSRRSIRSIFTFHRSNSLTPMG